MCELKIPLRTLLEHPDFEPFRTFCRNVHKSSTSDSIYFGSGIPDLGWVPEIRKNPRAAPPASDRFGGVPHMWTGLSTPTVCLSVSANNSKRFWTLPGLPMLWKIRNMIKNNEKNAKLSDFWTFRRLGSPRSKSLKIEIWMFLDVQKAWLISKVCALGGFPTRHENDIKYLLGVCALVRYGEISWILVDFCSLACGRIRAKCVKTHQKIVCAGVALPRSCLQLKMGVERPVHMCAGAVKIHQNF